MKRNVFAIYVLSHVWWKKNVSPIYVLLGENKNLVEVKDDSISGGEVCIRVDYLAVAELFADHHLIKQFDRTLYIAT